MKISELEITAINIIENEIRNGKKIYDAYCVASKKLNIPIYKCNNSYYTKWRFHLSHDVKEIIHLRKTEKQKALIKRLG